MSMSMSQIYDERHIMTSVVVNTKEELFRLIAKTLAELEELDEGQVREGLFNREAMMSTLIAPGIALPHAQLKDFGRTTGLLIIIPGGCDYGGGNRIKLAVVVLDDPELIADHQETLRRFALMARNPRFLEKILAAPNATQVFSIIQRLEMTS